MRLLVAVLCVFAAIPPAFAATADRTVDSGSTAWLLVATALVLFMTLPGLALFYSGLVRSKNVLSVFMQCVAITCAASLIWVLFGYGLAFGNGGTLNDWVGGGDLMLAGVSLESVRGAVPETVFVMFQMTFAVITPALVVGAFAERMKFSAMLAFSMLWLIIVYLPVCHWVWGGGWLAQRGLMDFAVHRPPAGLPPYGDAAAQHGADRGRRLHAVGGVVRIQCRQRPGRRRQRRHGDAGHAHRCGGRRDGLDVLRVD